MKLTKYCVAITVMWCVFWWVNNSYGHVTNGGHGHKITDKDLTGHSVNSWALNHAERLAQLEDEVANQKENIKILFKLYDEMIGLQEEITERLLKLENKGGK